MILGFVLGGGKLWGIPAEVVDHLACALEGSLTAVLRQVWQQRDLGSRGKTSNSRSGEVIGFWIYVFWRLTESIC